MTEERQLGVAKNVVLSFLERRLIVPKIYLDADWAGIRADLLAIDRDGTGDVHVVALTCRPHVGTLNEATASRSFLDAPLDLLRSVQVQFKYIALVEELGISGAFNLPVKLSERQAELLVARDFVGRVGLLRVGVSDEEEPQLRVEVRPERFRAAIAKLADEYVEHHTADWEIRA